MNRASLTEAIAQGAGISKVAAERALDAVLQAVSGELGRGGKVTLAGFGTLRTVERRPRTGRDPRTGAPIHIAARKSVSFTLSPELKLVVNPVGEAGASTHA